MVCQMLFKCYLFQSFRNLTWKIFFHRFQFFTQPLDNLFLTIQTTFNWNLQSIATSTVSFVIEYLRKECGDLNEVASDNDDDKDDRDDDANSKNIEVVEIGAGEALTMLDRLVNLR